MGKSVLRPATQRIFWGVTVLTVLVVAGGVAIWYLAFAQLSDLQRRRDQATDDAIKQTLLQAEPTIRPEQIKATYDQAIKDYGTGDFAKAATNFDRVVRGNRDYQDAATRLMLSYRALALQQSRQPTDLEKSKTSFQQAVNTVNDYSSQISAQIGKDPGLVPDKATFQNFFARLQTESRQASLYADGAKATTPDNQQSSWWDGVIEKWSPLYQENPQYLSDLPQLWIVNRLTDTYRSKATYMCRVNGDYGQALAAVTRGIEVSRNNKSDDSKLTKGLESLLIYINETQCQLG